MQKRIIATVDESPEKVELFYKAARDWDGLYPIERIGREQGYRESQKVISANQKTIARVFNRQSIVLKDGRNFFDLDLSRRVISPGELLAKELLVIVPHSDDLCWIYNLLHGQHQAGATLLTMLFASDCSGISAKYAVRYAQEHFDDTTYSLERLKLALSQERIREHNDIMYRIGGVSVPLPVNVDSCFEPALVKRDVTGESWSYLSTYQNVSTEERNLIIDYFKSTVMQWATSHWLHEDEKLAFVMPFLYDNHPVHRMLAGIVLDAFLSVPEKYQKFVRLFMYPSLDVLENKPGSLYYAFGQDGRVDKFNAWKLMNTQLQRREDFYLKKFPEIDSANARQILPPIQAPYAEKLIELKHRRI